MNIFYQQYFHKYFTYFSLHSRFQDVDEDSAVDLETTTDDTSREQNNNSMFQQNLESSQENVMNTR